MSGLMDRIRTAVGRAKKAIKGLFAKSRRSRKAKVPIYREECVDLFPERLMAGRLYLAGDGKEFWGAALLCPCGCGDTIQLNLLTEVRPAWRVSRLRTGITVEPSVWRQKRCRSPFFLRPGPLKWC